MMSELSLLEKVQKGDLDAFSVLCGEYGPKMGTLLRYCLYSEYEAEKAVQTCLISIFRNFGRFTGKTSFKVWAFRKLLAEFSFSHAAGPANSQFSPLESLILTLPLPERLPLILVNVYSFSPSDASAILNIDLNHLDRNLKHAMNQLVAKGIDPGLDKKIDAEKRLADLKALGGSKSGKFNLEMILQKIKEEKVSPKSYIPWERILLLFLFLIFATLPAYFFLIASDRVTDSKEPGQEMINFTELIELSEESEKDNPHPEYDLIELEKTLQEMIKKDESSIDIENKELKTQKIGDQRKKVADDPLPDILLPRTDKSKASFEKEIQENPDQKNLDLTIQKKDKKNQEKQNTFSAEEFLEILERSEPVGNSSEKENPPPIKEDKKKVQDKSGNKEVKEKPPVINNSDKKNDPENHAKEINYVEEMKGNSSDHNEPSSLKGKIVKIHAFLVTEDLKKARDKTLQILMKYKLKGKVKSEAEKEIIVSVNLPPRRHNVMIRKFTKLGKLYFGNEVREFFEKYKGKHGGREARKYVYNFRKKDLPKSVIAYLHILPPKPK